MANVNGNNGILPDNLVEQTTMVDRGLASCAKVLNVNF